jgi:hypothetical protein
MALERMCPACGLVSDEIRCPRCNTLLLKGCTGSCSGCGKRGACPTHASLPSEKRKPSDAAPDDAEHPGTPLER